MSERNDEQVRKLQLAYDKVGEALKAVEDCGSSVFSKMLREMLQGLGVELNNAVAWQIEDRFPYYGG